MSETYLLPQQWPSLAPVERDAQILLAADDATGPFYLDDPEPLRPAIPAILDFLRSPASWQLDPWTAGRIVGALAKLAPKVLVTREAPAIGYYRELVHALKERPDLDTGGTGLLGCSPALSIALAAGGNNAVRPLADLLVDDDERVRNLAGHTLHILASGEYDLQSELVPLSNIHRIERYRREPLDPPTPDDLSRFLNAVDKGSLVHPVRDINVETGGIVWFGGDPRQDDLSAMFRLLRVAELDQSSYAVFMDIAADFERDGFAIQLRILLPHAMQRHFPVYHGALQPEVYIQHRPLSEMFWKFILHQQAVWGTSSLDDRAPLLSGKERGDLKFGFMVEAHGVYRIWSRF